MTEPYSNIQGRALRPPTAWEREQERLRREAGTDDVYVSAAAAPSGFWNAVLMAVDAELWSLGLLDGDVGRLWWREMRWSQGLADTVPRSYEAQFRACFPSVNSQATAIGAMSAIEHLCDLVGGDSIAPFAEMLNSTARRFRVGVQLQSDGRFIELTSEHVHVEVVQPALRLLSDPRLEQANGLYRKAFDRVLNNDASGAITVAMSAVEETLRGFGATGSTLAELAASAQRRGDFGAGVGEAIKKLNAYRGDADAHRSGTDETALAWLVVHEAAAIILFLGRVSSQPPRAGDRC